MLYRWKKSGLKRNMQNAVVLLLTVESCSWESAGGGYQTEALLL